jgi:hypothetical protein
MKGPTYYFTHPVYHPNSFVYVFFFFMFVEVMINPDDAEVKNVHFTACLGLDWKPVCIFLFHILIFFVSRPHQLLQLLMVQLLY